MGKIGVFEPVKGRDGNKESFTELSYCHKFGVIFLHQLENKRQRIGAVRNDDIGKDRVGVMTGRADYPEND